MELQQIFFVWSCIVDESYLCQHGSRDLFGHCSSVETIEFQGKARFGLGDQVGHSRAIECLLSSLQTMFSTGVYEFTHQFRLFVCGVFLDSERSSTTSKNR